MGDHGYETDKFVLYLEVCAGIALRKFVLYLEVWATMAMRQFV